MSMDRVENAHIYWQIVRETLIEFYGLDAAEARHRVLESQGKMTSRSIARDSTYHAEPLSTAAKIAGVLKPIAPAQIAQYGQLVKRVTATETENTQVQGVKIPSKKSGNLQHTQQILVARGR